MPRKYQHWLNIAESSPRPHTLAELEALIFQNRSFRPKSQLHYGDHGLRAVKDLVLAAITKGKRIALYADYDVDGTMSCVSWIWFFKAIGFENFIHYIPCRFEEGYGLNLKAVQHLIDDHKAELIITMDTGITANQEAEYCKSRGVDFICTDHHKIQPQKMPDCLILNPKLHPEPEYQELCGAGITFVLLRQLGAQFGIAAELWQDILAIVGMATICDVVPLNPVNHNLAQLGVRAFLASKRPVFQSLKRAAGVGQRANEKDIGFRIGPRINAVGRLKHAHLVIDAFINENPDALVGAMDALNEERKLIQAQIVRQAMNAAERSKDSPVIFAGGPWHPGVVGIAASKVAESHWKPTWLFADEGDLCKGSARSIPHFDVTAAMQSVDPALWTKFGGHQAAGGFSFPKVHQGQIEAGLAAYAAQHQREHPELWVSSRTYDTNLAFKLINESLLTLLDQLRPFGHGFSEPLFRVEGEVLRTRILRDKKTGEPRHTFVELAQEGLSWPCMFFHEVHDQLRPRDHIEALVHVHRNSFMGQDSIQLLGVDLGL